MEKAESQPTVLVVDDVPENIDVLAGILRPEYMFAVVHVSRMASTTAISRKMVPVLAHLNF